MSHLKLRTQILLLALTLATGFLLFGLWPWHTIQQVKVGGPNYARISTYKDLAADILPPPNYIIESYLTVLQLADPEQSDQRETLLGQLGKVRQEYDTRHEFWIGQALPEDIKARFLNDAHRFALRFFDIVDKQFIPALKGNDSTGVREASKRLEAEYRAHRKAIDEVVVLATREQESVERATADVLRNDLWVLLSVFLFSVGLAAVVNYLFGRSLLVGIDEAKSCLFELAAGNLVTQPSSAKRSDEIGGVAPFVWTGNALG